MDKPIYKLVGAPCGQHGQYTFYKALRIIGEPERIIAIGDFFFVRLWQDSELVSVGELQLLWTDRISDQTLVSLRLYFLPENTPDGRNIHGEDEVLAINEKVVVRAEDLLSWVSDGASWRWGLRAVWRGACAPPSEPRHTAPLHHTKLDFSDIEREKNAITTDAEAAGVVVFSYPRYCRYRALVSRLEGIQADWLRDSLVAALGGYAAPSKNTRILYCKDTFEYPELEGHEFVCNHLAPRLKGRPRGRRRRRARSRSLSPSPSPSSHSSDSDRRDNTPQVETPRRLTLRNGADKHSEEEYDDREKKGDDEDKVETKKTEESTVLSEDDLFVEQLKQFYKERNDDVKMIPNLKGMSLRSLYLTVASQGGYEAVCRHKLWRVLLNPDHPARTRRHYERFLLPYENHERRNGSKLFSRQVNGKIDAELRTIATIDVTDSPLRDPDQIEPENKSSSERAQSPQKLENKNKIEIYDKDKDELNITSKPAEELNREFLESLSRADKKEDTEVKLDIGVKDDVSLKENFSMTEDASVKEESYLKEDVFRNMKDYKSEEIKESKENSIAKEEKPIKISVKPVEKLIERNSVATITEYLRNSDALKLFQENSVLVAELVAKHNLKDSIKVLEEVRSLQLSEGSVNFLNDLAQKLNLGNIQTFPLEPLKLQLEPARSSLGNLSHLGDKYPLNGHAHAHNGPVVTEQKSRPLGKSSLRAVRVKPTRPLPTAPTPPVPPLWPDSASSSPPVSAPVTPAPVSTPVPPITNFGIYHPPHAQPHALTNAHSDDEIVEVPYKPKSPEIIDLDEYPESPQAVKRKKLDILKERGLEVTAIPNSANWSGAIPGAVIPSPMPPLIPPPMLLNPTLHQQMINQAQLYQIYNIVPQKYPNGVHPPKVIQATSIFGTSGPEKTVYGNPKDPFMPPPHVLHGTPVKAQRSVPVTVTPAQDLLDLTGKVTPVGQKPAVEIVRVPSVPSPSKNTAQNLTKNYTILDGKAVVGSNLEITLVNPKVTPPKNRPPQKRSSNGKFMSTKTPTPPKDYPKLYPSPSPSGVQKKNPIVVPNYQIHPRDDVSPTSSTGSRESQTNFLQSSLLQNVFKGQSSLTQMMDMQKSPVSNLTPFMDPLYMSALYNSLGQMDHRQLAIYRDFMANQFRGYPGLNMGAVANIPTTKN